MIHVSQATCPCCSGERLRPLDLVDGIWILKTFCIGAALRGMNLLEQRGEAIREVMQGDIEDCGGCVWRALKARLHAPLDRSVGSSDMWRASVLAALFGV